MLTQNARIDNPLHASKDRRFGQNHSPPGTCLDHPYHFQSAEGLPQHTTCHTQSSGQFHLIGNGISCPQIFGSKISK